VWCNTQDALSRYSVQPLYHCLAHIPLDFTAKGSIAVGVDGLLPERRPAWPKCRACGGASTATGAVRILENEAMATKQTSKQAKTSVDPGAATRARQAHRRNRRARSRAAATQEATTAALPQAGPASSEMVHDDPELEQPAPRPIRGPADLSTTSESGTEQARASTKRARLIAMLERPEGASVDEIGQQLGWLRHTVRAAITGLRKAGREVTRSKEADGGSVYRLAPLEAGSDGYPELCGFHCEGERQCSRSRHHSAGRYGDSANASLHYQSQ